MAAYNYKLNEKVEICKKEEGFLGSYFTAKILAAVGLNMYLIRYETRYSEDMTRLLSEAVDASEIRPFPPASAYTNYKVNDKVDAYVSNAWRVGKVTRFVDPNYYVRLDCNGNEMHMGYDEVRIHLDWENGKWVYRPYPKPQDDDDHSQPSSSNQGGRS